MSRPRYHPHANDNRPAWFDELLLRYEPFLRKQAKDEDTYQEATCRALDLWYRFKPDGHFPTWLNYIVKNINHERRQPEPIEAAERAQGATQEAIVVIKETLAADASGLMALVGVGYTHQEIAKARGVHKRTIRNHLNAARAAVANDNDKMGTKSA